MGRGRIAAVVSIVAAALLAGVLWQGAQRPAWWSPPPGSDATAEAAWQVEQRLAAHFQRIRTDQPLWALRVREVELNLWLADRLPRWAASGFLGETFEWPESIGLVQVHLLPGRVEVAVELLDLGVVATIAAVPVEDARGWSLRWRDAGVGRLQMALAVETLRNQLAGRFDDLVETPWLAALLAGGLEIPNIVTLADGREVVLVGAEIGDGEVVLELMTVGGGHP